MKKVCKKTLQESEESRKREKHWCGRTFVTERSHKETHHDRATNTDDVGRPDILLGDTEIVTNLREQWSDSKPNKECF
eukprot:scaffold10892_cov163-Amphora_coffeaeformis.AAC.2